MRRAPRVNPSLIRRLYEVDAKGIVDEDLIDKVGYALYARCQSILEATEAHAGRVKCPECGASVIHDGGPWVKEADLDCTQCGAGTCHGASTSRRFRTSISLVVGRWRFTPSSSSASRAQPRHAKGCWLSIG